MPGPYGEGVLSPLGTTRTTPTTRAFRGSIARPSASLSTLRRRPYGIGPRKTRFRLVASLCRAGFTCRVPYERFPLCRLTSTSLPPFPGLTWRTVPGTSWPARRLDPRRARRQRPTTSRTTLHQAVSLQQVADRARRRPRLLPWIMLLQPGSQLARTPTREPTPQLQHPLRRLRAHLVGEALRHMRPVLQASNALLREAIRPLVPRLAA